MNTKLPNEILANIFCLNAEHNLRLDCCRFDVPEDDREIYAIPPPLRDTLAASQVCHSWRTVAINCPELWRHFIDPHHKRREWTHILRERSKSYGITYCGTVSRAPITEDELVLEAANADLLVSYSVAFNTPDKEDVSDCDVWRNEHMWMEWPHLKFLCITHRLDELYHGSYDEDSAPLLEMVLPEDFPSFDATPQLEVLHLHRCFVEQRDQISTLQHLTELRVHFFRLFSPYQWLEFLPEIRNLKRVALDNVMNFDLPTPEYIKEDWIVRLDLEEFCLKDHVSLCAKLFRHLDLRTSQILELTCFEVGKEEKRDMEDVLSRITSIVRDLLRSDRFSQGCALYLKPSSVTCFGGGSAELPERIFPDEGLIHLDFWTPLSLLEGGLSALTNMFQPIHNRVDTLNIIDNERDMFLNDNFLSNILWKSSHRLRRLQGVNFFAFKIIYENMFREGHTSNSFGHRGVSFLQALEDIEFWVDEDAPEEYPLHDRIVEFCKRKTENGNPLRVVRDVPVSDYTKVDAPGGWNIFERLLALGVVIGGPA